VASLPPKLKPPLDSTPYAADPRSRPAQAGLRDGLYAYVQDETGVAFVVPDGQHIHPKVLGNGRPAMYAGDLTIDEGEISDITNLSGTFQFDDPDGLCEVAEQFKRQGLIVRTGAIRFFPVDGGPPHVLG
jgi:hypothetical protein